MRPGLGVTTVLLITVTMVRLQTVDGNPVPSAAALCCIRCQGEGQDPRLSTVNLAACLGSAVVHFYTLW